MTKILRSSLLAIGLIFLLGGALANEKFGRFEGDLIVQAVGDDGLQLQLVAPFAYIDPSGKKWSVSPGAIVDGASIPGAFWSIIGGPFSGAYREASVIHDRYCVSKERDWEEVHKAFYNGMRAKGVGYIKAQTMYAAVYAFGPRWIVGADAEGKDKKIAGKPRFDAAAKEKLVSFVGERLRTTGEIDSFADSLLRVANAEEAEQHLKDQTDCGPVVSSVDGGGDVYMLCGLDPASKKLNAGRNLNILVRDLRKLASAQSFFLVPTLERYRKDATETNWNAAKNEVLRIRDLVKIAILSALDYDASLVGSLGSATRRLYGVLQTRAVMLDAMAEGPPSNPGSLDRWLENYKELMAQLGEELETLQKALLAERQP